jgi:putative Mg2+ transporter-C (MgtC) family protein
MPIEHILQLLLAILFGGLIGAEREYHNKAAGFRTLIFICLGSTLFTIFSVEIAAQSDPARIAAQIVTGVGFIGAGAIMRDTGRIVGLTTAATIWLVAALGIGIGIGQYTVTIAATLVTLVVLAAFPRFESWIDALHDDCTYEIISSANFDYLSDLLQQSGLRQLFVKRTRSGQEITWVCHLGGKPAQHAAFAQRLLDDPQIKGFHY